MIDRLQKGTRIRTTENVGSNDWTDNIRLGVKWGEKGVIVSCSDSHGLVYQVKHDSGGVAWYEPMELEKIGEGEE